MMQDSHRNASLQLIVPLRWFWTDQQAHLEGQKRLQDVTQMSETLSVFEGRIMR